MQRDRDRERERELREQRTEDVGVGGGKKKKKRSKVHLEDRVTYPRCALISEEGTRGSRRAISFSLSTTPDGPGAGKGGCHRSVQGRTPPTENGLCAGARGSRKWRESEKEIISNGARM